MSERERKRYRLAPANAGTLGGFVLAGSQQDYYRQEFIRLVSVADDDIQHAGQAAFVRGVVENHG